MSKLMPHVMERLYSAEMDFGCYDGEQRLTYMEARHADAALRAQRFFQRQYLGLAAADQQKLVLRMRVQQRHQRVDARIERVIRLQRRRWLLDVGM